MKYKIYLNDNNRLLIMNNRWACSAVLSDEIIKEYSHIPLHKKWLLLFLLITTIK